MIKESAENNEVLALLEKYGISVEDILSGNEEALAKLKERYLEISDALNNYEATGAMDELASSSDAASTSVGKTADAVKEVGASASTASKDIASISSDLNNIDASKIATIKTAFDELQTCITSISLALGEGGIAGAITSLNQLDISGEGGILGQFTALKEAIDGVVTAITGDSSKSSEMYKNSASGMAHAGDGADSLIAAFDEAKTAGVEAAAEIIGGEGAGLTGVNAKIADITKNIGTQEDTSAETLNGGINALGETVGNVMPSVVTSFENLATHISDAASSLNSLLKDLAGVSGVDINVTTGGGVDVNGNAFAHGSWGAKQSGATLVGELGQEIVVDPETGTWRTVGDNGAEFVDINRGDIVFNHKQTEAILKHGKVAGRGKALAGGSLPKGLTPLSVADSEKYNMLSMMTDISSNADIGIRHLDMLNRNVDTITKSINNVNNVNNSPTININNPQFTCTGVTGEQVLHEIEGQFQGLFLNAYQKSMKR